MEYKNLEIEFSWTTFLGVTGISFLTFCLSLRVLNGHYPPIFLWIGISGITAGIITGLVSLFINRK